MPNAWDPFVEQITDKATGPVQRQDLLAKKVVTYRGRLRHTTEHFHYLHHDRTYPVRTVTRSQISSDGSVQLFRQTGSAMRRALVPKSRILPSKSSRISRMLCSSLYVEEKPMPSEVILHGCGRKNCSPRRRQRRCVRSPSLQGMTPRRSWWRHRVPYVTVQPDLVARVRQAPDDAERFIEEVAGYRGTVQQVS